MYAHDALIWSPNVIAHHGILKQKWGVRHGPPYPLDESDKSQAQKKAAAADKKEESSESSSKGSSSSSSSSKKKSVDEMTDKELNDAINRLRNEKTYKELTSSQKDKNTISTGKQVLNGLKEVGGNVLKTSLTNIGSQTMTYVMGTEINKVLTKLYGDSAAINPKKGQDRKGDNNSNNSSSNDDSIGTLISPSTMTISYTTIKDGLLSGANSSTSKAVMDEIKKKGKIPVETI